MYPPQSIFNIYVYILTYIIQSIYDSYGYVGDDNIDTSAR